MIRLALLVSVSVLVIAGCSAPVSDTLIPDDPLYPRQWSLSAIGADRAWTTVTGSPQARVAVLDSGVTGTNDLRANLAEPVHCEATCEPGATTDRSGHGTAIAHLIGAVGNNNLDVTGVTWSTQIVGIQATDETGAMSPRGVVTGIRWAGSQGIPIVNLSLTLSSNPEIQSAITSSPATLFVVPAGNDGLDIDSHDLDVPLCRQQLPNVVCVAGLDSSNAISSESNRGESSVDLAAPGVDLLTLNQDGSPTYVSGTSYAVPLVSGAAALLLSRFPQATAHELKQALGCGSTEMAPPKQVRTGALSIPGSLTALESLIESGTCQ